MANAREYANDILKYFINEMAEHVKNYDDFYPYDFITDNDSINMYVDECAYMEFIRCTNVIEYFNKHNLSGEPVEGNGTIRDEMKRVSYNHYRDALWQEIDNILGDIENIDFKNVDNKLLISVQDEKLDDINFEWMELSDEERDDPKVWREYENRRQEVRDIDIEDIDDDLILESYQKVIRDKLY